MSKTFLLELPDFWHIDSCLLILSLAKCRPQDRQSTKSGFVGREVPFAVDAFPVFFKGILVGDVFCIDEGRGTEVRFVGVGGAAYKNKKTFYYINTKAMQL